MPGERLTVGLTAILDPRRTAHARTFLRGIVMAINTMPDVAALRFVTADDGASGARAIEVAEGFVRGGVDLVVGHFSSDAALTAAGVYERHGVPLLLPASTADKVTRGTTVAFRVCPSDTLLARRLVAFVGTEGWSRISVEADPSLHGRHLAEEIRAGAARAGLDLTDDPWAADAAVFAGRLEESAAYLAGRRSEGYRRPIVLTDDAASPALLARVPDAGTVAVIGFVAASMIDGTGPIAGAHRVSYGEEPAVYFLETVAALTIAAQLSRMQGDRLKHLRNGRFATVLGEMSFEGGECRNPPHALWQARDGRLEPTRPLLD